MLSISSDLKLSHTETLTKVSFNLRCISQQWKDLVWLTRWVPFKDKSGAWIETKPGWDARHEKGRLAPQRLTPWQLCIQAWKLGHHSCHANQTKKWDMQIFFKSRLTTTFSSGKKLIKKIGPCRVNPGQGPIILTVWPTIPLGTNVQFKSRAVPTLGTDGIQGSEWPRLKGQRSPKQEVGKSPAIQDAALEAPGLVLILQWSLKI